MPARSPAAGDLLFSVDISVLHLVHITCNYCYCAINMLKTSLPPPALVTVGGTSHRFQIFSEAHDCTESHEPCLNIGIQRPSCVFKWISQWSSKVSMKHLTSTDVFSLAGLLMAALCFSDPSQGTQKHDLVTFCFCPVPAISKPPISIVVNMLSSNNYHWPGMGYSKAQNTLQSSFEAG